MHAKGVAWRDVKPGNVVCVGKPGRGDPGLVAVDFGSACRLPLGRFFLVDFAVKCTFTTKYCLPGDEDQM